MIIETNKMKKALRERDANTARALAVVRFGHRPPARYKHTRTHTHTHTHTNKQTGRITIHCAVS